ncbi:MAG: ComEC family competence protein [Winogradskyella sp.]|uniref:ComEC/Rec2 family competence protein n=1 Tax=Winogradskyella sp. TaxID=1883156 RepID=UPI0018175BA7|nr:ComEC/Rec2 family competence protein [Winogradskyella sp.]MBT8245586.1 ComEC family competence protein [Winogradskyella sp.]NNK22856.1 ComEC family competence protein [Winogradskyella sp.]
MKLLNFNIIKLTLCLIVGIVIGFYFKISLLSILIINAILLFGLAISYYLAKSKKTKIQLFGITTLLSFICIGIASTKIYNDKNKTNHYSNFNIATETYADFTFKITKRLKPDAYNDKYFAEIISINEKKLFGKVLLNVEKDTLSENLKIGSIYFVNSKLTEVVKPKNPFQFNYNKYLQQRNVYHQLYIKTGVFISVKTESKSLMSYADSFRTKVNKNLTGAGFNDDVLSIINALLLGQRQDINPEIYNNYVDAGTIHILAVSGLHVGIIFLILTQIFKPLHRIKHGKHIIKPVLIIIMLWSFAFVAGLSPSVTRAVTMFSIITCAQFLRRPTNIYNTLTISAFLMLLFNPIYLFDVGFKMSYLAVLAIVSIQPLLYKLWQPSNLIIDKTWQIFTVTLAAQLGVAPISLFYFHQFPGLFFISNLVIIPLLGLILGFGILVITLSLLNILPPILVTIYSFIIESLNSFISWIAQFENFLLRDIPFSIFHVITSYLIIVSGFYLWKTRTFKSVVFSLLSILLFSIIIVYTKYENNTSEFVVFNKSRTTLLAKKSDYQLTVYHRLDSTKIKNDKAIKNYSVGNFITNKINDSLTSIYPFKDKIILIVDSLGVYNTKQFRPNYILLSNSPKVNLNRLIDSLKPEFIIADASNYKSYLQRWKKTCLNKKIPFHSTYKKGAFVLN